MIYINYLGRLGNNLFQYCFGRILSKKMNTTFVCKSLTLFPNADIGNQTLNKSIKNNQIFLTKHNVDIDSLVKNTDEKDLVLNGYFQKSKYYLDYFEDIRKWLILDSDYQKLILKKYKIDNHCLAIHVRLGDYLTLGYAIKKDHMNHVVTQVLKKLKNINKIYVITDDKKSKYHSIFEKFESKNMKVILLSNSPKEDFYLLTCFNNIIMSQSSFSWWAVFFSNAKNIFCPKTKTYGQWGEYSKPDINLYYERIEGIECEK